MADTTRKQPFADAVRAACKWLISAGIAAMLLPGLALAQIPDLKITHYQLVSSKRINATQFEYEYRVSATNSGAAAQQVTASVSPSAANTQVIDGGASFGTVPAGQTVASSDTIKLRQDRRFALTAADLHWHFRLVAPPVHLDGAPTAPVIASTRDFYNGDGVPNSEISDHPLYGPVARTKLAIVFQQTATTQQVNNVLDAVNGGITSMLAGSPLIGIRIPDPGSTTALDSVIAQVKQQPGVEDVLTSEPEQPKMLPENPGLGANPGALTKLNLISHQLAAEAHGMWNASAAYTARFATQPTLLIWDEFGGGAPVSLAWNFSVLDADEFGSHHPVNTDTVSRASSAQLSADLEQVPLTS